MTHHTTGPWYLTPDGSAIYTKDAIGYRGETITRLPSSGRKANAHLIAAAPDLLGALEKLHTMHRAFSGNENWTMLDDEARALAEAVIDKAKGK